MHIAVQMVWGGGPPCSGPRDSHTQGPTTPGLRGLVELHSLVLMLEQSHPEGQGQGHRVWGTVGAPHWMQGWEAGP